MRKQVPIDLELVQFALEARDGDGRWFLEIATGDAIRVGEDDDELSGQIEDGIDERYLAIAALQICPAERERWFAFQKERVRGRIRRWQDDIELVAPPLRVGRSRM